MDSIEVCQYLIQQHSAVLNGDQVKCIFNIGDERFESSKDILKERKVDQRLPRVGGSVKSYMLKNM